MDGLDLAGPTDTNILWIKITASGVAGADIRAGLSERGVLCVGMGNVLRCVMHHQVRGIGFRVWV